MDLRWSAEDLAWGAELQRRLGETGPERRSQLCDEAGIAAATMPSGERLVAEPAWAMIAMQSLGHVLADEFPVEMVVMAAHLWSPGNSAQAVATCAGSPEPCPCG